MFRTQSVLKGIFIQIKKNFFLDKNVIFDVTFSTYTSLNMLVEPSDECVHERDVNVNIRFVALGFGCNSCVQTRFSSWFIPCGVRVFNSFIQKFSLWRMIRFLFSVSFLLICSMIVNLASLLKSWFGWLKCLQAGIFSGRGLQALLLWLFSR